MKKLGDKITRIIGLSVCVLTGLIAMWFLFANTNTITEHALLRFTVYVALVGSFIGALLIVGQWSAISPTGWARRLLKGKYTPTAIIVFSLVVGLCLRVIIPIKYPDYQPMSDPKTYYDIASSYDVSEHYSRYVQEFPHVFLYTELIRLCSNIFGSVHVSFVFLNTVASILSSCIIYLIAIKLAGKSRKGRLISATAFTVWFLNPFEILFTNLSLPIVVANLLVFVILYVGILLYKVAKNQRLTHVVMLSIILGVLVGIGNYFRPIMSILVIALMLSILYVMVCGQVKFSIAALSIVLIIGGIVLSACCVKSFISYRTGLSPTANQGGWNFYVGSNMETSGRWNQGDKDFEKQICANLSQDDCQKELYHQGFERYKSYGVMGSLMLYIDKMRAFAGYQPYVYNVESIVGFKDSKFYRLMQMAIILYIFALFTTVIVLVVSRLRPGQFALDSGMVFVMLTLIGVFVSAGIMEVSQRYAQPIYPIVVVLALCLICSKWCIYSPACRSS